MSGTHIGALIEPEFVVEAEDESPVVETGANFVNLIARMIGRHEVLATVLDPLDGASEAKRAKADENVLGIKLE